MAGADPVAAVSADGRSLSYSPGSSGVSRSARFSSSLHRPHLSRAGILRATAASIAATADREYIFPAGIIETSIRSLLFHPRRMERQRTSLRDRRSGGENGTSKKAADGQTRNVGKVLTGLPASSPPCLHHHVCAAHATTLDECDTTSPRFLTLRLRLVDGETSGRPRRNRPGRQSGRGAVGARRDRAKTSRR
jgi:hypothetical protein